MRSAHPRNYWLPLLAALAIGCEANHYEIRLTPKEESLHRQLTCWREKNSQDKSQVVAFPHNELKQIAEAYGSPVPVDPAKKHEFWSEFSAHTPHDVGGSGSFTHWATPLGSVSAYVERFRGDDNLVLEVERRLRTADRLADLLVGWFTDALEGEPELPELRRLLEEEFRQDLKNLCLYGWVYDIAADRHGDAPAECLLRVGQYLSERGYFTPEQLPALTRAVQDLDSERPAKLLSQIQRIVASKMGVAEDQPVPECLGFLSSLAAIEASSSRYLRETDEFKRLLKSWEAELVSNPEAEKPQPHAVIEELVSEAFLANVNLLGGGTDQLSVTLDSPVGPFLTNGTWDPQAEQVSWSRGIAETDSEQTEFPTLLYALWSVPNETEQKEQFGRILLAGQELGTYCLWYRGLAAAEANEWDEFVADLRPDDKLVDQLSKFRFSHQRLDGEDEQGDLASTARELIIAALTDESDNAAR